MKNGYLIPAAVILLICFCCYGITLEADFVADDKILIVHRDSIKTLSSIPQLFRESYWGKDYLEYGLYRPIPNVTYALNYAFGGLDPLGYHLVNLILHFCNCLLIYRLAIYYCQREFIALTTALLFAAHPVHTEAVSNIAGRPELLGTLFVLLCWLAYLYRERSRYFYLLSLFFYLLGLFSKENAIVLIVLLVLADLCQHWQDWPGRIKQYSLYYGGFLLVAAGYLILRVIVTKQLGVDLAITYFRGDDAFLTRLFTMSLGFIKYFPLLIWPDELNAFYDFSMIPLTPTLTLPVLLSMVFIIIVIVIGVVLLRYQRLSAFAILSFFILMFPVSNLLIITGIFLAERLLYLPVLSICLLVAAGLDYLARHYRYGRPIAIGICLILLTLSIVRDYWRNLDWHNTAAFNQAFIRDAPHSARASMMLVDQGSGLFKIGDYTSALAIFQRAVEVFPNLPRAQYNLGLTLIKLNRSNEAFTPLQTAARLIPKDAEYRNRYGTLLLTNNQLNEAMIEFQAAIENKSDYAEAHNNLGVVYARLNRDQDARREFDTALKINPNYQAAANNLAMLK
jgi:protein O-mannosyl-transferase